MPTADIYRRGAIAPVSVVKQLVLQCFVKPKLFDQREQLHCVVVADCQEPLKVASGVIVNFKHTRYGMPGRAVGNASV